MWREMSDLSEETSVGGGVKSGTSDHPVECDQYQKFQSRKDVLMKIVSRASQRKDRWKTT